MIGTLFERIKLALRSSACRACGARKLDAALRFCRSCREKLGVRQPVPIQGPCPIHAATTFNPAVRRLIYGYKFYGRRENADILNELLIAYWEQHLKRSGHEPEHPENILVVPVPPHAGKASHLHPLASRFARFFGYDYLPDGLIWRRSVTPQHTLAHRQERFANIGGSLDIGTGTLCGHQRIIVIDDLTTSGATLQEACRVLQEQAGNGQAEILGLAIAKVPMAVGGGDWDSRRSAFASQPETV